MRTVVYVAGPYTIGDTGLNVHRMIMLCDELLGKGYIPICPLLNHFWHIISPHPPNDWLEYDRAFLRLADCLLRIPGPSIGADREVNEMVELDKPVFEWKEALYERMPEVSVRESSEDA